MNNILLVVWLIGFYLAVSIDAYLMSKIKYYIPTGKYTTEYFLYFGIAIYLILSK